MNLSYEQKLLVIRALNTLHNACKDHVEQAEKDSGGAALGSFKETQAQALLLSVQIENDVAATARAPMSKSSDADFSEYIKNQVSDEITFERQNGCKHLWNNYSESIYPACSKCGQMQDTRENGT